MAGITKIETHWGGYNEGGNDKRNSGYRNCQKAQQDSGRVPTTSCHLWPKDSNVRRFRMSKYPGTSSATEMPADKSPKNVKCPPGCPEAISASNPPAPVSPNLKSDRMSVR